MLKMNDVQLFLVVVLLTCIIGVKSVSTETSNKGEIRDPSFYLGTATPPSGTIVPQDCDGENYSPCSCLFVDWGGNEVTCDNVPLIEVKTVFNASKTKALHFVKILTNESDVPDDVLGGKRSESLVIVGQKQSLKCSPAAFTSTKSTTTMLSINSVRIDATDFGFLDGFTVLEAMYFHDIDGIFDVWANIPLPPSVYSFGIEHTVTTTRLNGSCPTFAADLSTVSFTYNLLDDASMSYILKCILGTSRWVSGLSLDGNTLTTVPPEVASFENLVYFWMENNIMLTRISAGSLHFPSGRIPRLLLLSMRGCGTKEIEPGAFVGNFESTVIDLTGNNLTRFESAVFSEVLQQMSSSNRPGYIDIEGNPIDCESDLCSLDWLIVNNNQVDQQLVHNGRCSNGTIFEYLNPTVTETYCEATTLTTSITTTHIVITSEVTAKTTSFTTWLTETSPMKTDASTTSSVHSSSTPNSTAMTIPGSLDETPSSVGTDDPYVSTPKRSSANSIIEQSRTVVRIHLVVFAIWISTTYLSCY